LIAVIEPSAETVLIVEDDASTQLLLGTLMRRNGFEVVMALHGTEAIERLRERQFPAIILDLMMPDLGGQDVIAFLDREKRSDPVIVCTAAGPRVIASIESKIVKAVIRKPFDIEELTEAVKSVVRGAA
jgi:CheY-like chemotaxis protein